MKKAFVIIPAALMLAAPAFAGSPDNPGAHGEAVSNAAKAYDSLGQAIKAVRESNPDYKFSDEIKAVKEFGGGAPNPANDNGGGND